MYFGIYQPWIPPSLRALPADISFPSAMPLETISGKALSHASGAMSGSPFSIIDVMIETVSPMVISAEHPYPFSRMILSRFARTSIDCQFILAITTSPHSSAKAPCVRLARPTAKQAGASNFPNILVPLELRPLLGSASQRDRSRCGRNKDPDEPSLPFGRLLERQALFAYEKTADWLRFWPADRANSRVMSAC